MYEVLDQIYVVSSIENANSCVPEIQIGRQPLFERSSIFIPEDTYPSPFFDCAKKNAPEMYKCDYCGFEVFLKVNLKVHMETVHKLDLPISINTFCSFSDQNYNLSNILKCYNCQHCDFATHSLLVLFKHELTFHRVKKKKISVDKFVNKPLNNLKTVLIQKRGVYSKSDESKQFKCGQCKFSTNYKHYFKKHIEIKHRLPEDGQLYECDKCYFKTFEKCKFDSHKRVHDAEVEFYKCNFCYYMTKRKHRLKAHIRYKHTSDEEVPKFYCGSCPYWAKQKTSLSQHILVKHTSEENITWFFCKLCPFKSKTSTNLRKHMIVHSEDKFLLCEMCSTQFKRWGSLQKHMMKKHNLKI